MEETMKNTVVTTITRTLAVAGVLFAVANCSSSKFPNDPLPALVCDDGYILNATQDGCLPATSVIVHGVVVDSMTSTPLAGVNVLVEPFSDTPVTTDANGYFKITGYLTDDHLIAIYSVANYTFSVKQYDRGSDSFDGTLDIDLSAALVRLPLQLNVAGTVFAGDTVASGARVLLVPASYSVLVGNGMTVVPGTGITPSTGTAVGVLPQYTTTTDATGHFAFANVLDGIYTVRVLPFDANNDQVADFNEKDVVLTQLSTDKADNITNLVVPLSQITKQLVYTNLLLNGGTGPYLTAAQLLAAIAASQVTGGLYLNNPAGNIIFAFGAPVDTTYTKVELVPIETKSINGGTSGDFDASAPLAITATWSNGNTLLTIDPTADLIADGNNKTLYAVRFTAFRWADGQLAVNAALSGDQSTFGQNACTFTFDVGALPAILTSPVPAFYTANHLNNADHLPAVAANTHCFEDGCILSDANLDFVGFPDTTAGHPLMYMFGAYYGFSLTWTHVPGAVSYNVYVRQRNTNHTSNNFANWYITKPTISSNNVDPNLNTTIVATNILANGSCTVATVNCAEWADFQTISGAGALAFGNQIDFAVTAVDANGYESPLATDAANMLTIKEDLPSFFDLAGGIAITSGLAAPSPAVNNMGNTKILKTFTIPFGDNMNTATNPAVSYVGGSIANFAAVAGSYDWGTLIAQNFSKSVKFSANLSTRGTCTPMTCDANYTLYSDTGNAKSVCVKDPSIFANGNNVFVIPANAGIINNYGAIAGPAVNLGNGNHTSTVSAVDAAHGIVTFSDGAYAQMTTGDLLCVLPTGTTPTPAVNYTQVSSYSAGPPTTISVSDASIFHVNQPILLVTAYGPTGGAANAQNVAAVQVTVTSVYTGANNVITTNPALTLVAPPLGPSTLPNTSTYVIPLPNYNAADTAEYALRAAENLTSGTQLRYDVTVGAGTVKLQFLTGAINSYHFMDGDLVMIDLDGDIRTTNDEYFATISAINAKINTSGTGDNGDYSIELGAPPAGLTALPAATFIRRDALVVSFGDAFIVTNSTAAAGAMTNSSAIQGLLTSVFAQCGGITDKVGNSLCYGGYLYF
jgi:hypothetical protein